MQQDNKKSVSTDLVEVTIDPRGFLRVKMLESKAPFDLDEAKKQFELISDMVKEERFLALVDTRNTYTVPSVEAKKFLASVDKKIAEAVIVNSLGNRILGNLYLKMVNNRYPIKMFSDEENAIKWLLSHKK